MKNKLLLLFSLLLCILLLAIALNNDKSIIVDSAPMIANKICKEAYYYEARANYDIDVNWIVKNKDEVKIEKLAMTPGNKIYIEDDNITYTSKFKKNDLLVSNKDYNKLLTKMNLKNATVDNPQTIKNYIQITSLKPLEYQKIDQDDIIGVYEECKEYDEEATTD